ncbi:MAG: HAD-IA family hydrolase [Pseudonocardia sp.]|nr:HAD-IA family hydrolase [Pseudonocardia sp.]
MTIAVAGAAGSGKSTLGRALATALRLPLLDLDAVTNPLLDQLVGPVLPAHWLAAPHGELVRDGRYAALRAVAHDVVATAGGAVLVAPFTAELTGGSEWAALLAAVAPTEVQVVHIDGDPGLLERRRTARGAARDAHRPDHATRAPAVPHIAIAPALTPEQQLARALRALGHRTAVDPANPLFGHPFDAVLFDLDGVLVDSTASVARSWDRFAEEFGVSSAALQENHGQPAQTLVESLLGPDRVPEGLARIEAIEVDDAAGVEAVPGAQTLFASLPEHRRAVVTSGTPPIATARLRAGGFPLPRTLVTADDIERGKPDPQPYLLAAHRLGVPPGRCLAVEDAPAGIASARAAGCQVLAVTGTADAEELASAALIVDGLDRVAVRVDGDVLRLEPGKPR